MHINSCFFIFPNNSLKLLLLVTLSEYFLLFLESITNGKLSEEAIHKSIIIAKYIDCINRSLA